MGKFKSLLPNTNLYDIFIGLILIYICLIGKIVEAVVLLSLYLVMKYYIEKQYRKNEESENSIKESYVDSIIKKSMTNIQIPAVLMNDNGDILWNNKKFSSVFNMDNIIGSNMMNLVSNFNISSVKNGEVSSYKYVNILDQYYDVDVSVMEINRGDKVMRAVAAYFYNVSPSRRNLDYRESIMLIEVDNLDEVIKGTDEDKRPILAGEIERCITTYAMNLNAMIRKYSSNKYILTVKDSTIKEEMNKKFDILDTVRDIEYGNKIDVTISIGVGRLGESPMINNNYANSAKELALGRGGDQVVVKSGEKLDFFGGKTKEVEKRTKVRARVIAHALRDLIEERSTVYIMGHKNPDMDAFGSALGLASVINRLGKRCRIILKDEGNNGIDYILENMKKDDKYKEWIISPEQCLMEMDDKSLLILVDVHSRSYVQNESIVDAVKGLVIIDHHRRTVDFIEGALLTYIESYASSTSELVTEMIQYMMEKPKLNRLEAEALLAGICIDTKNFFLKTGVRTFEAASFLRRLGADTIDVKKMFGHDLQSYIKKSDIIKNAVVEDEIAIAVSPAAINEKIVVSQAADELLNITGIEASFVLAEVDGDIYISGRSLGDINVQLILEALGGGGHLTMAGAKLMDVTMEEAVKKLKEAINKYSKEGE